MEGVVLKKGLTSEDFSGQEGGNCFAAGASMDADSHNAPSFDQIDY